eukprot:g55454.t1
MQEQEPAGICDEMWARKPFGISMVVMPYELQSLFVSTKKNKQDFHKGGTSATYTIVLHVFMVDQDGPSSSETHDTCGHRIKASNNNNKNSNKRGKFGGNRDRKRPWNFFRCTMMAAPARGDEFSHTSCGGGRRRIDIEQLLNSEAEGGKMPWTQQDDFGLSMAAAPILSDMDNGRTRLEMDTEAPTERSAGLKRIVRIWTRSTVVGESNLRCQIHNLYSPAWYGFVQLTMEKKPNGFLKLTREKRGCSRRTQGLGFLQLAHTGFEKLLALWQPLHSHACSVHSFCGSICLTRVRCLAGPALGGSAMQQQSKCVAGSGGRKRRLLSPDSEGEKIEWDEFSDDESESIKEAHCADSSRRRANPYPEWTSKLRARNAPQSPKNGGSISVFVSVPGSRIISLCMDPSGSIGVLQKAIEEKEAIPVDKQFLVFNGRPLEEGTLTKYGVGNDSVIQLYPYLPAAGPT